MKTRRILWKLEKGFEPNVRQLEAMALVKTATSKAGDANRSRSWRIFEFHPRERNHKEEFLAVIPEEGTNTFFTARFSKRGVILRSFGEWKYFSSKNLKLGIELIRNPLIVFGKQLHIKARNWQDLISEEGVKEYSKLYE